MSLHDEYACTQFMAPLAPEELLIFFQSALIRTAETRDVLLPALLQRRPSSQCSFGLPQAGCVAIQSSGHRQSHHLNRDEQGE